MKGVTVHMYPNYYQMPTRTESVSNRTMKVYGTGKVMVEPNIASVQLGVVTEDPSLTKAQQENARIMNQVIQSLNELGVPPQAIQTSSFTIRPIFDYKDGKPVNQRYQVMNTLQVMLTDFEAIGAIIDRTVLEGVNRVFDIQFSTDQQAAAYDQALQSALEDGTRKASTIAQNFHVVLDTIPLKIIEQTSPSPVAYKAFSASAESTTTPIQAGQIEVEANVELLYRYSFVQ